MRTFLLTLLVILTISQGVLAAPLDDAYKSYLNEDYEATIDKAKSVPQNDEALYLLGLAYLKMGNYPESREYFLKLTQNFPHSEKLEEASLKIADSYFLEGDYEKAMALYKEVEKKYPSSDYQPLIYSKLAQVATKEGQWDERKKYLSLLKEKYSQGTEINLPGANETKEDFFTIQVGAFSTKKNALSLSNELSAKYKPYIIEEKADKYTLYKVRIGKFKDRKKAEMVWGKLIKQGYPAHIFP